MNQKKTMSEEKDHSKTVHLLIFQTFEVQPGLGFQSYSMNDLNLDRTYHLGQSLQTGDQQVIQTYSNYT